MFSLILKNFENDQAILKDADGRLYIWPKKHLPEEAQVGQEYQIKVTPNNNQENQEEKADNKEILAKNIINEILNPQ